MMVEDIQSEWDRDSRVDIECGKRSTAAISSRINITHSEHPG